MDIIAFDYWVRKVAYNKKLDYLKKRNRIWHRELSLDYKEEGWTDEYFVSKINVGNIQIEIHDGELYQGIKSLNGKRRDITLLYYFAGYTDDGIGQLMDTPKSSVNFNRHRALDNLKQYLEVERYAYAGNDKQCNNR